MIFILLFVAGLQAQGYTNLDALDMAQAEREAALERELEAQRAITEDTTVYVAAQSDAEIYVTDTVVLMAIEQIDGKITALKTLLYNDKPIREILELKVDDQIRYLEYLIKFEIKTVIDAIKIAQLLVTLRDYEIEKTKLLLDTQAGDNRARIFLRVKKLNEERKKLLSYINMK